MKPIENGTHAFDNAMELHLIEALLKVLNEDGV